MPGEGGAAPSLTSCLGQLNSRAAWEDRAEPIACSLIGSFSTSPSSESEETEEGVRLVAGAPLGQGGGAVGPPLLFTPPE